MANTYLTRTFGTATSRTKFTVSVWLKKCTINSSDNDEKHFFNGYNSSNDRFMIYMTSSDQLKIRNVDNGSENVTYVSNARFRDVNSWYHVVIRIDTSLGSGNRIRAYVNGEQITSWASSTESNQGADFALGNNAFSNIIGSYAGTNHYWNGIMSHFHYCDGQSYAPTEFGETDSTTGEWKIKTDVSVNYGNEGFFMFKDDNSLNDDSGNGNNFTVGAGTLTKTEDCPSNVFATLNKLTLAGSQFTLRYGNNSTYGVPSSAWRYLTGTLGASSGKYYWEMKFDNTYSTDPRNILVGILDFDQAEQTASNGKFPGNSRGYAIDLNDGKTMNNTTSRTSGATYSSQFSTGDILGVAMDLDNSKLYFAKNGTWQNSSDPTSGATGTGSAFNLASGYTYTPAISSYYNQDEVTFNFGNGYFGTTAVSSAGTNASGNGIFEHDCPAGFTALSTKGLNL